MAAVAHSIVVWLLHASFAVGQHRKEILTTLAPVWTLSASIACSFATAIIEHTAIAWQNMCTTISSSSFVIGLSAAWALVLVSPVLLINLGLA